MTDRKPSRTHTGVIRRQARRLVALGVLRSCTEEAPGGAYAGMYEVVTTGGDTAIVPRRDMPAYLDGLAQGYHAAQNPERVS